MAKQKFKAKYSAVREHGTPGLKNYASEAIYYSFLRYDTEVPGHYKLDVINNARRALGCAHIRKLERQ